MAMLTPYKLDTLPLRFSGLFWGLSGTGKTIFASTGRRPILYLCWDVEGFASVEDRKDFHVLNMADYPTNIVEKFKDKDEGLFRELETICKDLGIKTIVNDSITKYVTRALEFACDIGRQYQQKNENVSDYKPGWTGYRIRTLLLQQYISNMGMFASRLGLDCIFIGHEDQPKTIGEGETQTVLYTTMRLGGDNAFEIPVDVREVWHFRTKPVQNDQNHLDYVIAFRPFRFNPALSALMRPMKTTMFDAEVLPAINWEKGKDRLDTWIEKWITKGKALTDKDI